MSRFNLLCFLYLFSISVYAQNKDTLNISITNFTLNPGTFSWRGTGTFYDRTSWNSSPYTEGHLKQNNFFRMNYRLLFPVDHNPNYEPGYPMIVMLHGGGERGNCWGSNCYCTGCDPNDTPDPLANQNFLNNDHNLVHGGSPHLTARNLAGNKLPDDPTLHPRAFPGFVFFPQMLNQWKNGANPGAADLSYAIRIIRLLVKQYNIDPDRIYIHGLSFGGQAVLEAMNYADWLFAAAAPMSALVNPIEYDSVRNIPMWFFQGGRDGEPTPAQTETAIRNLRERGANIRYSLYPTLGHGTWNTAYAEPDFFSWLLSHRKSNIHVDYNNPNICGTTGAGASLVLAQGFPAYQWERDGKIIPGATSHTYIATFPGVYRARFSRKSANPTEEEWNRWSDPVVVGEKSPEVPVITHEGTHVLSDLNRNSILKVEAPAGYVKYTWYHNGGAPAPSTIYNVGEPHQFEIRGCTWSASSANGPCTTKNGAYTVIVEGFDKCPSLPSAPKYVVFGTHNQNPQLISGTPTGLTATPVSPTSFLFKWTDNSPDERGFELWRRKRLNIVGEDFTKGWVMAAQTGEDETVFLDTGLEPNSTYYYKLRAINSYGRSNYWPGNSAFDNFGNVSHNLIVTTGSETIPPTPPSDLIARTVAVNTIQLTWRPSTDAGGIKQYIVYYNGTSVATNSADTTVTLSGLTLNTVYTFTVKAEDFGNNLSEASNPSVAHTYASGLFYKHSTGAWSSLEEVSLQATFVNPEFTGWVENFTLAPRTQEDFFNFEFSGYFYVEEDADYQFRTNSDDGSRLFLNNDTEPAVDNDGLHGTQNRTSGTIALSEGPIPIRVEYFEYTGGQALTVSYRKRNSNGTWPGSFTVIPASLLRSGTPPPPSEPPATPTNPVATATGMQTIDLDWDYDNLDVVVLGSSTAFGTGASPIGTNSWVNLFTAWLNANTTGSSVTNLALGGFDTRDVLPDGDPARNITHALSLNPDIIIVNLPSNDVNNNITRAETIDNLEEIRDLALAQGVMMFITTTQPRNFGGNLVKQEELFLSADDIRATFGEWVIDIYDELANLPAYTIKPGYDSGDGIHVNNAGHQYIYETVRDKVSQYIPSFEIQRSLHASGPFTTIARTQTTAFGDTELIPSTTYYYRLRATSIDTVSAFTGVVNATTFADDQVPTQPGQPVLITKSFSTASFSWTPQSTDNVSVKGYEVYQDGQYVGFSPINAYQASDLEPGEAYTFYVIAVDLNDNKSLPSPNLVVNTNVGQSFFTKANGTVLDNLTSWENGDGQNPASFQHNGQFFVVQHPLPVDNPWSVEGTVSKVIVDDNVSVTVDDNPVYARVEIPGNGILNLGNAQLPEFGALSASSTVNYTYKFIKQADYGNLSLTGTGAFTFPAGTTKVRGNLLATDGAALKGASGNTTSIELTGNLTVAGTPAPLASGFGIDMRMVGNTDQDIEAGGTLDLFRVIKTGTGNVNLLNTGSPVTLNLGSTAGGGLSIPSGSEFNLGNNALSILWAGTLNGSDEGGLLSVTDGSISVTSSSASNSHLRFKSGFNTVHTLAQNMTGGGNVQVHNAVNISDGVKITDGDLLSNGNITLLSNALKTANLQEIENNGQVIGNMNVQRYMSNKSRTYRYMSSSVEGVTVSDWQAFFPITGNFVGTSTGPGLTTSPSLYIREAEGWVPYPRSTNPGPYNDSNAPIEKGRGYAAFVRNTTPVLIQVSGVPYQGDVVFDVFPPQGGDPINDWNLLGNPYASTIAWSNSEAWDKDDVGNIIAVRNNFNTTSGQFQYFDAEFLLGTSEEEALADGKIAPGQAFWVQATGPDAAVTIKESAKHTGQQTFYREGAPMVSHLRVKLNQGAKSDAALILLTDNGTDNFDPKYDGLKMTNDGIHGLSTMTVDDHAAAINNFSSAFCSKNIRLNIAGAAAGTYDLVIESPEALFGVGTITLVDHFLDSSLVITSSSAYTFAITSNPASTGKTRFEIVLDRPAFAAGLQTSVETDCAAPSRVTLSNTQAGVSYAIYNGETPVSAELTSSGNDLMLEISPATLENGENRLNIKASFKGCSSRFIPDAVVVHYYATPTVTAENVSVCEGAAATLSASGASTVAEYQWFDESGKIKGATGPVLVTDNIDYEKYYFVRGVDPNGCAGPKMMISVSPEQLDMPEIIFSADTMSTHLAGEEYIWARNGETIYRSSTDPQFVPGSDGTYTLTVRKGGCSKTSREQVITGIEDETSPTYELYPNPTTSGNINLRVQRAHQESIMVRIVDVVGRELHQKLYSPADEPVIRITPKNPLRSGVYFIILEDGGSSEKIRFIIQE